MKIQISFSAKACVITMIFLWADVAAYFIAKPMRAVEWYHAIPGGGFVRLYQGVAS